MDANGNPYITGTTNSTDFPVTPGVFQSSLNGFQNIFVTKLNSLGNQLLYSTLLGGSGSDGVSAMAFDAGGSVYVAGYALSTDFPTAPHAYQPRHVGDCNGHAAGDAFVSKLSPDASSLVYSTLLGGSCAQTATGIALDSAGHAYISGATISPDFPVTQGVLQPVYGGSTDGFLAELTTQGHGLVFATYLGGPNADVAAGVSVDSSGNIYVGGNGIGFSFAPPPPAVPLECGGSIVSYGGLDLEVASQPYLLKVNPGATAREWLQSFADCGTVVQGVALDSSGQAWLGGIADAATYDTVAPFQTLAAGTFFVRQYASDARTLLFSTLLDSFQGIALDNKGVAYIAAEGTAPGARKQLLNGTESQPSAAILKVDASVPNPLAVDTVQKAGKLSIAALADYAGPIGVAGGELVTLNGHGLGPSVAVGAHVTSGFVDTSLAGVVVQFDGAPVPLISVQNNQIICVAPYAVSGDAWVRKLRSNIQVINNGVSSNMVAVSATPTAAGVLQLLNQDGTVNSSAHPAPVGSTMTAYVTGLGIPIDRAVDGLVGSVNPQTFVWPVSVVFNDPAQITYIGSAPGLVSGITQINFIVPAIEGQSVLSVNAGNSTDFVFVYVR